MTKTLQSESSPTGAALSDNDISLVASMLCLSAMLGVAMFAYIADTYGRRVCIMTIAALQAVSSMCLCCPGRKFNTCDCVVSVSRDLS